ncbi:hypothetical protein KKF84_05680, partial [Myxococcota bacterium]|nr:hypothetical protein [Myxococcota bacterium]
LVIYRSSLESEIMEQLEELGLNHFTKWTEVLGQGAHSEPHLDSHIWPGSNNVLGIVTDKTTEDILYDMVARIRKKAPGEGIKALTLPLLRHS